MLKKLFLFFAIFMASVFSAMAQNSVGYYICKLDVIKMNETSYNPVENQEFKVSSNLKLTGKVAKIGKMPGDINISLAITETGNVLGSSTAVGGVCGKLNVLGFIPVSLILKDFHGTINGDDIEFTLKCDGLYKNSPISAEVHYTGKKQ